MEAYGIVSANYESLILWLENLSALNTRNAVYWEKGHYSYHDEDLLPQHGGDGVQGPGAPQGQVLLHTSSWEDNARDGVYEVVAMTLSLLDTLSQNVWWKYVLVHEFIPFSSNHINQI